ncbi:MAG: elongation factor Ts, partial [Betaproteobacteria bacterium]|nr:elongation factor Ts [Betaproteobacteria bacterium]
ECKKALTEAAGDMAKAEEILRVKLGNKANKAASRVAAEGVVAIYISSDQKLGAMVEVNCETDFVAKNEEFIALSNKLAELVATQNPEDVATLSALKVGADSVEEIRKALIGKIGENITVRRFVRVAATGALASYIHGGAKIGTLVDISGGDVVLAKDVAMHIAAAKPVALLTSDVPAALVEKEREIARQKAAESGKPAEIIAKMVDGSVAKYLKEVALMGQPFVKDDKQTIEQLMRAKSAMVNAFTLYVVGEGIEKKVTDFAAEVAETAAAAAKAAGA